MKNPLPSGRTAPVLPFELFALETGFEIDLSQDEFPTRVRGHDAGQLHLGDEGTHYGVVASGMMRLVSNHFDLTLYAGQHFAIPGRAVLIGGYEGQALVITRRGYAGLPQLGGSIGPVGRLKYIDGCSDTLLLAPPLLGDPCLNHLHIPPGVNQTAHTHPSNRIGVILRGSGVCKTREGEYQLTPGLGWWIPTGCVHSFHTRTASCDVVAWHPDSDFGPTHEAHPMLNKTFVGDVSVAGIDAIRTREIVA